MTHLISAHEQMARALDDPLVNVGQQLNARYGRCLDAHDLISRVRVVAREIDERGPRAGDVETASLGSENTGSERNP
jgi:hypothetical protein